MSKSVVTYREFCNPALSGRTIGGHVMPSPADLPSMFDSVVDWDPVEKAAVLEYMRNPDFLYGSSTSSYKRDLFTGKTIPFSGDVFEDQSGNVWRDYLTYYIDAHDVGLPREFIDHVLSMD